MIQKIDVEFIESGTSFPQLVAPEISHDEDTEDMTGRKNASIGGSFIIHCADGRSIIVSVPDVDLPTPDYPIEKAFAFIAASAAEKFNGARTRKQTGHD
jgi:hypothetical protein